MSDVFISYSRKDSKFVRRLFDALEKQERDVWVDWEDIPLTADWWNEICTGIEAAHTFVFVISPDSIASPVCNLEVAHALQHNKRLVPVVRQETDEKMAFGALAAYDLDDNTQKTLAERDVLAVARDNWGALARHNWLFFEDDADFEDGFQKLLTAIDTDLEHVRTHTRLLVRAKEWDDKGHDNSLLLRGGEITGAETWLAASVGKEPLPTELHTDYIAASRRGQRRGQQRLLTGVSVALVVAIGLAILSFFLFQQSENNLTLAEQRGTGVANQASTAEAHRVEADNNAVTSDANAATATFALGQEEAARATSEANLLQAWDIQSLFLSDLSRQQLEDGSPQNALLLALESLEHYPDIVNVESNNTLLYALANPVQEVAYLRHEGYVYGALWNGDESRILSWSQDNTVRVWDAGETSLTFGAELLTLRHKS